MSYLTSIKLSTIGLAAAGALILQAAVPALADGLEGNARLMLGQKSLESEDWSSRDEQNEFGVLLDIKKTSWPVSIAIDLFGSGADSNADDLDIDNGYTVEQHFGIRKTWTASSGKFHPYLGGGLAVIHAGLERRSSAGGAEDDDSGVGTWFGGGAYWDLTSRINLGVDVRYSEAEVTVFDQEIEAGGVHAGVTLGYNW